MDKQVSISVGIVVASPRAANSKGERSWEARAAMVGENGIPPGDLLKRDRDADYYFAGAADLNLSASDIEAYRANLTQDEPLLYCLMARRSDTNSPPLLHLVTADREEAERYVAAAPDLVNEVAMPSALADLISIFIDGHADDDEDFPLAPPKRDGATVH